MNVASEEAVLLGLVVGAHGIKGLVRVLSYTEEPADIAAYGALADETGRRMTLAVAGRAPGTKAVLIARVAGVADRNAAEALKGRRLYVHRAALPRLADADEFYRSDLVGLEAVGADGGPLGRVTGVLNYGAGDVLEIQRNGRAPLLVPFTRSAVPRVDLAAGRLVVVPPEEVDARPRPRTPPRLRARP